MAYVNTVCPRAELWAPPAVIAGGAFSLCPSYTHIGKGEILLVFLKVKMSQLPIR